MELGNLEPAVNLLIVNQSNVFSEKRHSIRQTITYKMNSNISNTEIFGTFRHCRKCTSAPIAMRMATGSIYKRRAR